MQRTFSVRGVPASIVQDGWWLADEATIENDAGDKPKAPRTWATMKHGERRAILLVLLVLLGDVLFWKAVPGISLVLFAWAIFGVVVYVSTVRANVWRAAALLAVASLPAIEFVQSLSMIYLFLGLVGAVAWVRACERAPLGAIVKAGRALALSIPLFGIRELWRHLPQSAADQPVIKHPSHLAKRPNVEVLRKHLRNWAMPVGGALLLLCLLVEANPVIERRLQALLTLDLNTWDLMMRALFWGGLALFLSPLLYDSTPASGPAMKTITRKSSWGLNVGSVLRALVLFNLMLGLQTVMDMSILLAGASLPDGMTLAEYAHRGAYPLLLTAMLAGVFALMAHPFLEDAPGLRPLMLIWLGQNMLLCVTSAMRLDLYVDAFGLTYLRLHAAIGMMIVFAGLGMAAFQVVAARSQNWLVTRFVVMTGAVLYLCCFINFAGVIASANLSMDRGPDWYYLCSLGPAATPHITAEQLGLVVPSGMDNCWKLPDWASEWRSWNARHWRVARQS